MMTLTWLRGELLRRARRIAMTTAGIAVAVALLASLGAFVAHSKATMTQRSVANVAVDWQVESQPGANAARLFASVRGYAGVRAALPVEFGQTSGLRATTGGTVQTTGPGFVLGIPDQYRATFPAVIRNLVGSTRGVLVSQQTAANLRVAPGDRVTIARPGLPATGMTVDGVVDLPTADSLFQQVGAPPGAQPKAPPDTVMLVTASQWHRIFDPLARSRPDLVKTQIHARLDHALPTDPSAAYSHALGQANNLEVSLAGAGLVGNNIGRHSRRPAPMPSTRRCSSSSSACRAQSWPAC